MPAEKKEVEDAKNEGINFLFQNNIWIFFQKRVILPHIYLINRL